MKKSMTAAGAVVALMLMPGVSSAATFSTPAVVAAAPADCATDEDGGSTPIDEDTGQPVGDEGGDGGTGDDGGSGTGNGEEPGEDNEEGPETTSPETTSPETTSPETTSPETTSPETTSSSSPSATSSSDPTSNSTPPSNFSAGRAAVPGQQDCSEALEPGSGYSDEDGDGEPEKVDRADDDGDGRVDEIDTRAQVSTVPDGGAETGDGSTEGAVGMTLAGGAVLALLVGVALWVRRAMSRH